MADVELSEVEQNLWYEIAFGSIGPFLHFCFFESQNIVLVESVSFVPPVAHQAPACVGLLTRKQKIVIVKVHSQNDHYRERN